MAIWAVLLLVILEIKHFVFDFVLQTPYQLKHKGIYGHPGGLLHSGLHALGTLVALAVVAPPVGLAAAILVGEFGVHYHLDWAKDQIGRRMGNAKGSGFWRLFGLDQLLHQLTYVAIFAILFM